MVSAKSRRYGRPRGTLYAEPSILVVTEGTKTEPKYFGALRQHLHLAATQIEVVPADGTDPRSVVRSAVALVKERKAAARRGIGVPYGETWVVLDSEHKLRTDELIGALCMAGAAGVNVAMSAPCFEFWFILHFEYTTQYMWNYAEAETKLKSHVPAYDKSYPPMDQLLPLVSDAVRNAERCVTAQEAAGAELPRTDVHKLVIRMNSATRKHNRIL